MGHNMKNVDETHVGQVRTAEQGRDQAGKGDLHQVSLMLVNMKITSEKEANEMTVLGIYQAVG